MAKEKGELLSIFESLQRQRDELMLQLHLGKAEAKDELAELEKKWDGLKSEAEELGGQIEDTLQAEWDGLEKKWTELKGKTEPLKDTVEDISEDMGAAAELVGEEIKRGYERLKKLF